MIVSICSFVCTCRLVIKCLIIIMVPQQVFICYCKALHCTCADFNCIASECEGGKRGGKRGGKEKRGGGRKGEGNLNFER